MNSVISPEEFLHSLKDFCELSAKCYDNWKLYENDKEIHKSYTKKEQFVNYCDKTLFKAEYVIFYNLSYGVPSFSFNLWNSEGKLLTLDEIRKFSSIHINEKEFYSVVTQQEHPIFNRPYFIVHPCHTETLLATFKQTSKNIIVTFLSLITPIVKLDLPVEYGL